MLSCFWFRRSFKFILIDSRHLLQEEFKRMDFFLFLNKQGLRICFCFSVKEERGVKIGVARALANASDMTTQRKNRGKVVGQMEREASVAVYPGRLNNRWSIVTMILYWGAYIWEPKKPLSNSVLLTFCLSCDFVVEFDFVALEKLLNIGLNISRFLLHKQCPLLQVRTRQVKMTVKAI